MSLSLNRAPHTRARRSISSRDLQWFEERHSPIHQEPSLANVNASAPLQRLVERDLPYHQSSNSLQIRHQYTKHKNTSLNFFHWYVEDWFHVLLRLRTIVSAGMFVVIWTLLLLLFACVYMLVDRENPEIDCGLGHVPHPIHFSGAFAFSLETTTTVGYGIPNGGNAFFENCPTLQVAIYFQMLISMFFNAFLLSFVFARLSRSEARAAQVLFSNKAIINREVLKNGITRYVLSTRIYDADSRYPIVEAHVRFYAVKHRSMHAKENRDVRFPIKMEAMRVSKPNDDYGAYLYTSIPTTCTHHIDVYSPILPPDLRKFGPENGRLNADLGFVADSCHLDLRENDSYVGGRDSLRCVICGETYSTVANLIQHIRYNQHTEKHDGVPVIGSHQELDVESIFKNRNGLSSDSEPSNKNSKNNDNDEQNSETRNTTIDIDQSTPSWYEEHERYLKESNIEIICIMEAIDPITSGTFQAIQSYTINDIEFDREFAPCILTDGSDENERGQKKKNRWLKWVRRAIVGRTAVGRAVKIDLDMFHETVKIGEGCL